MERHPKILTREISATLLIVNPLFVNVTERLFDKTMTCLQWNNWFLGNNFHYKLNYFLFSLWKWFHSFYILSFTFVLFYLFRLNIQSYRFEHYRYFGWSLSSIGNLANWRTYFYPLLLQNVYMQHLAQCMNCLPKSVHLFQHRKIK